MLLLVTFMKKSNNKLMIQVIEQRTLADDELLLQLPDEWAGQVRIHSDGTVDAQALIASCLRLVEQGRLTLQQVENILKRFEA